MKTWEARFLALQPGSAVQWSLGGGADREQVREGHPHQSTNTE